MTQYIKHYYKKTSDDTWITSIKKTYNSDTNEWITDTSYVERRYPEKEYPGLGVKVWMEDDENIDICLSELPDSTSVENVSYDGKKVVQILNEDQFNAVKNLMNEIPSEAVVTELQSQALELEEGSDEKSTKLQEIESKENERRDKYAEAKRTLESF